MRRISILWLALLAALIIPQREAWSTLSDYQFSESSTTYTALTGATTVINSSGTSGTFNESAVAGPYSIGFNFVFDGTTYSQFSVNTGGLLVLGSTTTASYVNLLESPPVSTPIISPFWDHFHMYAGDPATCPSLVDVHVSYLLTGTAPNRVLIVEWHTQFYNDANATYYYAANCLPFTTFQLRLFESSNQFSFTYGAFRQNVTSGIYETASIGFALGGNNFVSVTPGSPSTISRTTANNAIDNYNQITSTTLIPPGTVYTFNLCGLRVTGRTGTNDGGTTAMASGDTLMKSFGVQRGGAATYTPFDLAMPSGNCPTGNYRLTISGTSSSDYYFGAPGNLIANGSIAAGSSTTPQITFRPTTIGRRNAILTITDLNNGSSRVYNLGATGTTRINWIGNIAQGGTPTMANGDTLLKNFNVVRRTSQSFTPFTLRNFNIDLAQTPLASITYTITDPTGQYSIAPPNAILGANQSNTPTIVFLPTGVASQPAILTVNADGEVRTFVLYAFSAAPGADFILNGLKLGPNVAAFVNQVSCVGEFANTQPITVNNVGVGDVTINTINFYQIDTVYRQGVPSYPLLRDANGNPILMRDYIITLQPGVAPTTANQKPILPILIPTGQTRTIYVTFVGQIPGKRSARAYFGTNAQNFAGIDLSGNVVDGLVTFDLFGRATGAMLSDNPNGGLPKAVIFPVTRAGDSSFVTFTLMNPGLCDLRISKSAFRINSGDVSEFTIMSGFAGIFNDSVPQVRNDYVLTSGQSTTVTVRFKPSRSGSRRATLVLRSNDSTVQIPGLTERGAYYMDLSGTGKAGLDYTDLKLSTAVIDAPANAGGTSTGTIELTNASKEEITISRLAISGASASEIVPDPSQPWPTLPTVVQLGQTLKLAVILMPTAGSQPGMRTAQLDVTLGTNETFAVAIEGYAGTRQLTVTPPTLFAGTTVAIGTLARQTVAVSNLSTVPVTVQQPVITGTDAADYQVQKFVRLVLAPGQIEFLEVSYVPSKPGSTSAQLEIVSDATNGKQTVALSATAAIAQHESDPASQGTAGVGAEAGIAGVELLQSVPNPTMGGMVEIGYRLKEASRVELRLYDATGKEVRVMERGMKEAGEHTVKLDVSELSSGTYRYRLMVNAQTLTRSLNVVR